MSAASKRDLSLCPTCGGTEVERTSVARGYYDPHGRFDAERLIRYTDRCPACGTVLEQFEEAGAEEVG
jgi:predicted RNA-binding Zn-ribbon protein involved in translation (DUF1610 family)